MITRPRDGGSGSDEVLERPNSIESCFRMLASGRVDIIRVNDIIGWPIIDSVFETREPFRMIEKTLSEAREHLIISKQKPDGAALIEEFNAALMKLKKQGKIHKRIEHHVK